MSGGLDTTSRCSFWASALPLLAGCLLFLFPATLRAAPRAGAAPQPSGRALELRSAGLRALAAGDHAAATQTLEGAYRLLPDADGLYLLGSLAWAEGRILAAQDLVRRYLAEVEAAGQRSALDAQRRDEAARILAVPGPAEGELAILGPAGAWVVLDGRLVGRLPLSRPLGVSAGPHQLVLEAGARTTRAEAQVPAGRTIELRAQTETGSMVLTQLPVMGVLTQHTGIPAEAEPLLAQAVASAARRERFSLAPMKQARGSQPSGCPEAIACLDELARRSGATYVLDERIAGSGPPGAPTWAITLRLLSAATGELAAERALRCNECSPERAAAALQHELAEALSLAAARPSGELELRSEPAGAEVWSEGRRIGLTPYRRAAFIGSRAIELRKPGYGSWSTQVLIEENKTSALFAELKADPPQARPTAPAEPPHVAAPQGPRPVPDRLPRPRWRLIAGGVSIALGGLLIGFGASALATDGQCSSDTPETALGCRRRYASGPYGAALLGVGGATLLTGVLLASFPGARRRPTASLP